MVLSAGPKTASQHSLGKSDQKVIEKNDPGRTRTCCLKIRNLALYPDELRDHALLSPEGYVLSISPRALRDGLTAQDGKFIPA